MLAVLLWIACAGPEPTRAPPPIPPTGDTATTHLPETEDDAKGGTETGTPATSAPTDPYAALLISNGYCEVGDDDYGYLPTTFQAWAEPEVVHVSARSFFEGCDCRTVQSIQATLTDEDLVVDLDHGKCDRVFCCAYTLTVSGLPSGTYHVQIPEIFRGEASAYVTVP